MSVWTLRIVRKIDCMWPIMAVSVTAVKSLCTGGVCIGGVCCISVFMKSCVSM